MKTPWATYGRFETADEMQGLIRNQVERIGLLKYKPKITVACVYRRDRNIHRTIESLMSQSYSDWELLIISDGSAETSFEDKRIQFVECSFSTSADAKNNAIMRASGEWFGMIDSGDLLSPVAFFEFAFQMNQNLGTSLFYCNEVKYDHELATLKEFWSKGRPSWFNLIHFNSVGRFFLVKTSLLHDEVPFAPKHSPDEEQGFLLKLSLRGLDWRFIPEYLYYRSEEILTSVLRRREIVEEHLAMKGMKAFVGSSQSHLDVQPIIEDPKAHLISVVIPFKDKPEMTLRCVEALGKQRGEVPLEVFLINNHSVSKSLVALSRELHHLPFSVKVVDYLKPFNFGDMNNEVIRLHTKGDLLFILNNDVFLEGSRCLDQMAAWALPESTGTVGIRLHYEHGKIQHSGFDASFGGFSRMVRVGNNQRKDRFSKENHEVFGSTFACCMMKRKTYDLLGGFREIDLANGFGDIAFNFDCIRQGLHNLYLGQVHGLHLESTSRGVNYEYWEECILERQYPDLLQRMLREDLGIDRLPAGDEVVFDVIKESAKGTLRKHAPWLKTIKQQIEKKLRVQGAEVT